MSENTNTPIRFDTETGQPIYQNMEQLPAVKLKKTGLIIIIAVVIILLLAAGVVATLFLSTRGGIKKVEAAIGTTIAEAQEKNLLYPVVDISDFAADREYTVSVKLDTEVALIGDVSVNSNVAVDKDIIQMTGDVDLNYIPPVGYTVTMNDKRLSAQVPFLNKYLFVYDYTKEDSEYIRNYIDTEVLNARISQAYTSITKAASKDDLIDEAKSVMMASLKGAKVSKTPKINCTIDGKEVNCEGYKLTLTPDAQKNIIDGFGQIVVRDYSEAFRANHMDAEGYFERLKSQVNSDMGISFYIYKDKLAKIIIEGAQVTVVDLKGGDYRLQNVDVAVDDNNIVSISGTIEDGTENLMATIAENTYSYKYDTNYGDLKLNAIVDGANLNVDMGISRSKKELKLDVDYFDFGNTYFGGKITVTDGASIVETTGEEFDLGSAKEESINALKQEILGLIMGLLGLSNY